MQSMMKRFLGLLSVALCLYLYVFVTPALRGKQGTHASHKDNGASSPQSRLVPLCSPPTRCSALPTSSAVKQGEGMGVECLWDWGCVTTSPHNVVVFSDGMAQQGNTTCRVPIGVRVPDHEGDIDTVASQPDLPVAKRMTLMMGTNANPPPSLGVELVGATDDDALQSIPCPWGSQGPQSRLVDVQRNIQQRCPGTRLFDPSPKVPLSQPLGGGDSAAERHEAAVHFLEENGCWNYHRTAGGAADDTSGGAPATPATLWKHARVAASVWRRRLMSALDSEAILRESITIAASHLPISQREHSYHGGRKAVRQAFRVRSYPPITDPKSHKPTCSLLAAQRLDRLSGSLNIALHQQQGSSSARSSSILIPQFFSTVSGPLEASQPLTELVCIPDTAVSDLSLAPTFLLRALRRFLTFWDASDVRFEANDNDDDGLSDHQSPAGYASVTCTVERRLKDEALCLDVDVAAFQQLGASFPADERSRSHVVAVAEVTLQRSVAIDTAWAVLLGVFLVICFVLKPLVLRFQVLQFVIVVAMGVIVTVFCLLYYVVNDFRKTNLGRMGIVALITAGSYALLSESIVTASMVFLTSEAPKSVVVQGAVVLCGIASAAFAHVVLRDYITRIITALFALVEAMTILLMWGLNPEATTAALVTTAVGVLLPHLVDFGRMFTSSTKSSTTANAAPLPAVNSKPPRHDADGDEDDDDDNGIPPVPDSAREFRPRVAPLCVQGRHFGAARTQGEAFRAYEAAGSRETRKALQQLAETIRKNPSKYLSHVHDPNGLARFAGIDTHRMDSDDA